MSWEFCFISFFNLLIVIESRSTSNLLTTSSGVYEGRTVTFDGITVHQYLGIQYATIQKRFQKAVPVVRANDNIISASSFGPFCKPTAGSCIGHTATTPLNRSCMISYGIFATKSIPVEQCLFLNVFIPIKKKFDEKRAVFIWIHGGSGQMGTGNLFDGTVLAALGDVIVVTFNFRLNLFGFLSSGDERFEGNLGLYDQALVLDWIYNNSDALGADRHRITVGGHSAGAPHAYYLAASPLSQKRIKRLVLQSGSPFNIWSHLKPQDAMEKFDLVALDNGCGDLKSFDDTFACLQEKDFSNLAEKEHHSYTSANHTNVVLGGIYMSQYQERILENDILADIDVLVGATDDEGIYVAVVPIMMEQNNQDSITLQTVNWTKVVLNFLSAMEPKKSCLFDKALEIYNLNSIPQNCSQSAECFCSAFYNYSRLISDILFNNDYYRFLDERIKSAQRTFIYQYSYQTSQDHPTVCNKYLQGRKLVGHFAELEYTWGTPLLVSNAVNSSKSSSLVKYIRQESNYTDNLNLMTYSEEQRLFSKQLIEQWSNFIKYGRPTSSILQKPWPKVNNLQNAHIMHLQPGRSQVKRFQIPVTVQFWLNDCATLSTVLPLRSRSNTIEFSMFFIFTVSVTLTIFKIN